MAYEVNTNFPNKVDDRVFYNDIDLEHLHILGQYKDLLIASKYDEASDLLQQSNIDYFGSWLLNLFELRIRTTQEYLLNNKEKPKLQVYSPTEPTGIREGIVWIE